tara:strand:- start:2635 stop:3222 length:588 start_codon:yes stop_codon:yes gene_type:complete
MDQVYRYYKEALPKKFCDDVVKFALNKQEEMAKVGEYKSVKDLKKVRDSNVVWLDEKWIFRVLQEFVQESNKEAGWNYQWDRSETVQFTKYNLNQFYDWHCDLLPKANKNGTIRKISMTCQLTDETEYEGGELEFDTRDYHPEKRDPDKHVIQCKEILKKGSIVVFPSSLWHRVKPVTKGVRYSLVCWNLGKKFV